MDKIKKQLSASKGFRMFMLALFDVICIILSWYFALWVRFDFRFTQIEADYLPLLNHLIVYICIITILVYYLFKMYQSIWSFFSINELSHIVYAYLVLAPFFFVVDMMLPKRLPLSIVFLGTLLSFLFAVGVRFSYRFIRVMVRKTQRAASPGKRTMIIGAGDVGADIQKELYRHPDHEYEVVCYIDDNPYKWGKQLNGIPIAGSRNDIAQIVEQYKIAEIILAIPTAKPSDRKAILNICQNETDCHIRIIPSITQMVNGDVKIERIRPVEIDDLLGRDNICVDVKDLKSLIGGKAVLVTGAGGSIGSELCRQIAKCQPIILVCFDIYENNLYTLQQELKREFPQLNGVYLIGSVRNAPRVEAIIKEYHPEIVFHAAAHKHVPLMEDSPAEAIKNNVFGTLNVGKACCENGVKRFLLISTDKAVNPTNVMGASKRLCEEVIQYLNKKYHTTDFVAVRFGNVLGSNGSVIPLFKQQIAEGGPVTVTHPDIIRYFMTIPEAVSLVLQACFFAKGGEIFVLDMGEPVKIADMARNLIRLSGYEPDVEIPIVYTGLRPGEKLYEELLMDEEGLQKTKNHLIFIAKPIDINLNEFAANMKKLRTACADESSDIRSIIEDVVSTYHPENQGEPQEKVQQTNCDKEVQSTIKESAQLHSEKNGIQA